jgi:hypothetical protein
VSSAIKLKAIVNGHSKYGAFSSIGKTTVLSSASMRSPTLPSLGKHCHAVRVRVRIRVRVRVRARVRVRVRVRVRAGVRVRVRTRFGFRARARARARVWESSATRK